MGKRVFTKKKMPKVSAENADKIFHGRNAARLGTEKNPAAVTVRSEKREQEIVAVFEEHGWKYTISVDPDKPEDISELERLLQPPQPAKTEKKAGRNDSCPCGSGKKYKKCCGK